jgi:hypothetical protein
MRSTTLGNGNQKSALNMSSYTQTSCVSSLTIAPVFFVANRRVIEDEIEYELQSRASSALVISDLQEPGYESPNRPAMSSSFWLILRRKIGFDRSKRPDVSLKNLFV